MSCLAPAEITGVWSLDTEAEIRRRLDLYRAAAKSRPLQRWLMKRCAEDFRFWLTHFAWTHDPKRPLPRIPARVDWSFQWDLYGLILGLDADDRLAPDPAFVEHQNAELRRLADEGNELAADILGREAQVEDARLRNVIVAASREVGKSLVLAYAATWVWLFRPGTHQIFISLKREKVDDNTMAFDRSLFGKIRNVIKWCPAWMRPPAWRVEGRARFADRHMVLLNDANGAAITGQSTDPDAIRGERAFRVYVDEANSIPWLGELLEAVQHVGPAVLVSSVKGMTTHYARLWHGKIVKTVEHEKRGGASGWVKLRWHYSMRPDRDPATPEGKAWFEQVRPDYADDAWNQEMELDFAASTPGRIWGPDIDDTFHVYTPRAWQREVASLIDRARIVEAWDFGSGAALTAVVWGAYFEATDTLYVLDYRQWERATDDEVAKGVADAGFATAANPGGIMPHARVGDAAGRQRGHRMHGGRRLEQTRSWVENLGDQGIKIRGHMLRVEPAIALVRRQLRKGRLFFSPRCATPRDGLPSALDCAKNYRRQGEDAASFVGHDAQPLKDVHSHIADAIQHLVAEVWPRIKIGNSPVRYRT